MDENQFQQKLYAQWQTQDLESLYKQYVWGNPNQYILDIHHPVEEMILNALQGYLLSKKGYIYIASLDKHIDVYKVGMTRKIPDERIKDLNSAGVFYHLKLCRFYTTYDVAIEHKIHQYLKQCRYSQKEFFTMPLYLLDKVCSEIIEQFHVKIYQLKLMV